MDFLQEKDSMAHKDWLSMRDQGRAPGKFMRFNAGGLGL
jgi:hypothetical protein